MFRSRVVSVFLTILLLTSATVVFGVTLPSTKLDLGEANGVTGGIAFSPDGRLMATGLRFDRGDLGREYKVAIWDASSGRQIALLDGSVSCLVFSPDSNTLIVGAGNRKVTLWDMKNMEHLATLKQPAIRVGPLAISSDGTLLAVGNAGDDVKVDTVSVWNIDTKELVDTIQGYAENSSIAFMGQSNILAVQRGSGIELLDMDHASPKNPTFLDSHVFVSSADGESLIYRDLGGAHIWNVQSRQVVGVLKGEEERYAPDDMVISPDGSMLVSILFDPQRVELTIWDVEKRKPIAIIEEKLGVPCFSPDNKLLATANEDGEVIFWHISGGGGKPNVPPVGQVVDSEGKLITPWGSVKSN